MSAVGWGDIVPDFGSSGGGGGGLGGLAAAWQWGLAQYFRQVPGPLGYYYGLLVSTNFEDIDALTGMPKESADNRNFGPAGRSMSAGFDSEPSYGDSPNTDPVRGCHWGLPDSPDDRQLEHLTRDSSAASDPADSAGSRSNLLGSPPEKLASDRPELNTYPIITGVHSDGSPFPPTPVVGFGQSTSDAGGMEQVTVHAVRPDRGPLLKPRPNVARPPGPVVVGGARSIESLDAEPNAGVRQGDWMSTSDPNVFLWQPEDFDASALNAYPVEAGHGGNSGAPPIDSGDPPIDEGGAGGEPVESVFADRPERSAASAAVPSGRTFWSRGGAGLAFSGATAVGALFVLSNPVGWVVGVTGALMVATSIAGASTSSIELWRSYSGATTREQDEAANKATSAVLGMSSPGGLVGGVVGTVATGTPEGLAEGQFWGGLGEGALTLGTNAGGMVKREIQFGLPTDMRWNSVRPINQRLYKMGGLADRGRVNPLFPRSGWYGNIEWRELSHTIPKGTNRLSRLIGAERYQAIVNRPFNVTPMWGTQHALIDPLRYGRMQPAFQALYRPLTGPARWTRLTPPWAVRSAYGGYRAGMAWGEHTYLNDLTP